MSDKPSGKRPLTRKVEARVSFRDFRKMRQWAGKGRGGMSRLVREFIAEREAREAAQNANASGMPDNDVGANTANDRGKPISDGSRSTAEGPCAGTIDQPSELRAAA